MAVLLLYTFLGRQLPLPPKLEEEPHAQKGNRKQEREDRHMGTLSVSVHEEEESAVQTLLPGGSEPPGDRGHAQDENCTKDLGHTDKSSTCTLYSLYMYICTHTYI